MPNDDSLREHLLQLLKGGHAHATFEDAIRDFPVKQAGVRPKGSPYSAWELLEHLRIAQNDILRFCESAEYESPKWPEGYWPKGRAPEKEDQWDRSVRAFREDMTKFEHLIGDPARDLHAKLPWGDGQTLLREALLVADHNSYHVGQLVLVRRLLGTWPE